MSARTVPYAIALFVSTGAIVAALVAADQPSDQALLAARWTARVSLPLFLIVYLVRPWHSLMPSRHSRAILANRRHWGLGFALSHTIHLAALLVNITMFRPRSFDELLAGMAAYALLYVMVLTSNRKAQRLLGRWWKRLHTLGIHYIWFIFFAGRVFRATGENPAYHLAAWAQIALLLAALAIRVAAWPSWRRFRR